jgi:hypothetical protein
MWPEAKTEDSRFRLSLRNETSSKSIPLRRRGLYGSWIFVILTCANRWRWPVSLRTRFFGLYLKTSIFLSLPWCSTVPVTVAPLSVGDPTDTESPPSLARTTRSKVTSEPTWLSRRSHFITSPSETLNCFPPVSIIAYITLEDYQRGRPHVYERRSAPALACFNRRYLRPKATPL